jgi:hypothetical protein
MHCWISFVGSRNPPSEAVESPGSLLGVGNVFFLREEQQRVDGQFFPLAVIHIFTS